jgi:spermidine synthase
MEKKWFYEKHSPETVYGYHVTPLLEEKTDFQNLQIVDHEHFGRMMILDDVVQTTEKDEFIYHEMMTHVPILALGRPAESILIIGGGDGGILQECLRHDSVKRVTMVDIDGRVIEVSKEMLFFKEAFKDPRLELIVGDGAAYVAGEEAQSKKFDIVIVDSPDPIGPALVLFEAPFYKNIRKCLNEDGIMVRQAGVPVFQAPELKEAVEHAQLSFPKVQVYRGVVPVYGGDMAFVIASANGAALDQPREKYTGRYYHQRFHTAAFVLPAWWYELTGLPME